MTQQVLSRLGLVLTLFLLSFSSAKAQDTSSVVEQDSVVKISIDSLEKRYGMKLYGSLEELADSVYVSLHSRKFQTLEQYLFTTQILKDEFDTVDMEHLNRLAHVKSQYVYNLLRKQHKKLIKETKAFKYNLRTMELIDSKVKSGTHREGHEYGEVIYYVKSGKRKYYLTFVAVKMMDCWFLADELGVLVR